MFGRLLCLLAFLPTSLFSPAPNFNGIIYFLTDLEPPILSGQKRHLLKIPQQHRCHESPCRLLAMSRSHGRATDLVSIIPPRSGIRRLIFSNTPLLGVFSSWLTSFPSQFFPPLEESRSSFVFSLEKFLSALIDICFARTCETSHDGNTEGGHLCESTENSLLSLLYHTLFSSSICIREEVKDLIH